MAKTMMRIIVTSMSNVVAEPSVTTARAAAIVAAGCDSIMES